MKATVSFPRVILALIFCTVANSSIWGQDRYRIAVIGFYNLENLFDTVNDTTINDEDFLPTGANLWTPDKYREKQGNMARVISEIGTEKSPDGVAIWAFPKLKTARYWKIWSRNPPLLPAITRLCITTPRMSGALMWPCCTIPSILR